MISLTHLFITVPAVWLQQQKAGHSLSVQPKEAYIRPDGCALWDCGRPSGVHCQETADWTKEGAEGGVQCAVVM